MGFDICGLRRQVELEFVYQGKHLKWNRYMRIPLDLSSLSELIDDYESVPSPQTKYHVLKFTLRPNNTYEVQLDD